MEEAQYKGNGEIEVSVSGGISPTVAKEQVRERLPILKTYKLYIGGEFPRTESGRYYLLKSDNGAALANVCRGSRKDLRDAVVAARTGFENWSKKSAYNRGQILYRIAEMLEGRREQFISELRSQAVPEAQAVQEVDTTIDRLVYYAGWTDKFPQIFGSVNPVSSSHFNFSIPEPSGVVAVLAPEENSLLGFVSSWLPALTGGNSVVVLASTTKPLCAVSFAEVLATSDITAGAINLLTGLRSELIPHMAGHMDINAIVYCGSDNSELKSIETEAARNIKRVIARKVVNWFERGEDPYWIMDTQEIKTTWHPIGN